MRTLAKFDRHHIRCWCPEYGQAFEAARVAAKLTPDDMATALNIDVGNILGYRRGFQRNAPPLTAAIEKLLGAKLPYHELTPSQKKRAAAKAGAKAKAPQLPLPAPLDPILAGLAATARAHGYDATFAKL